MTTQTSMVAQQTRLRQWAEQIRDCRNRPDGMDIKTWCAQNNITKANYYYRLRKVREACLEQMQEQPSFVEVPAVTGDTPVLSSKPQKISMDVPLIRIHNHAGITMDIFQDIPADKIKSLVEVLAYVK